MASDSWVRPLGSQEKIYHSMYKEDCLKVCYVLRLRTSKLVSEQNAREVFTALLRTTPSLRMYIQERDGLNWFREMAETRIDLGVIPNADVHDEYHKMVHHSFEPGFPLWSARLLPWSPEQVNFVNNTKLDQPEDGSMSFLCHILIGYHHAITDGFSSHEIMKLVLNRFEDVLSGKVVNVNEQNSVFVDCEDQEKIILEIALEFKTKQRNEERFKFYNNVTTDCILPEGYKVPLNAPMKTVCLTHNLDKETTHLFKERCKKEGVTFNSGFTAILDAAYVKLLLDGNVFRDSYRVTAVHSINCRSYFKNYDNIFGNCVGLMDITVDTPKDVMKNFWLYAKKNHQMIKGQQEIKNTFEHRVIEKLSGDSPLKAFDPAKVKEDSLPPMIVYATSNMMDVTKLFTDSERKNVQLDWYDRHSSLHIVPVLWFSCFQTFKGQLMHSLQYNSHFMSSDTAQKLSDNIFQIISEVV